MDGDPPDAPRADPGRRIAGRYRVRERLGFGGFAEVWAATDDVLNRPVAVKRLLPHLLDDAPSVARFRREAVALARVNHPGVIAVFDTVAEPDCQAIVMELVDGDSLGEVLQRDGVLDPIRVVEIGIQVFDALDAAHRQGLVHHDVSPANLLMGEDGSVRLGDFGLATSDGRTHTLIASMSGTAAYVAPEQVAGGSIDARADLYSAAAVLYEAACGRPPFERPTEAATMLARLTDDIADPRDHRPALPDGLVDVLLRCLSRSPADRPPTAAHVAVEFRRLAASMRRPTPSLAVGTLVGAGVPMTPTPTPHTLITVGRPESGSDDVEQRPRVGIPPRLVEPSSMSRSESSGELAWPDRVTRNQRDARKGRSTPSPLVVRNRPADADRPSTRQKRSDRRDAGRSRRPRSASAPAVGIAVALVVAGASLLVVALVRDPSPGSVGGPSANQPVVETVSAQRVDTLDPRGTGRAGENDQRAPLLIDGDASTSWSTERYLDRRFGTKPGVGVAVTLEADVSLVELTITSRTDGWRAEISATEAIPDGLPPPGRIVDGTVGDLRIDLRGMRGRVLNLWITQLGPVTGGFSVELAEVAVTGRR